MRFFNRVLIATAAAMVGCVGPTSFGASSPSILEIDPSTEPLGELVGDSWESAPQGCEGRLADPSQLSFLIASANDHLVAAVDEDGSVVCVDTVEAVQEELDERGDSARAERLGDQFLLGTALNDADALRGTTTTSVRAVSPHDAMDGANLGDPTPQPNINPRG